MGEVKQVQVTFDCADPRAVAEFWKVALGYVDPPVPEGFESWDAFDASLPAESQGSSWACQDPAGVGPRHPSSRIAVALSGRDQNSACSSGGISSRWLAAGRGNPRCGLGAVGRDQSPDRERDLDPLRLVTAVQLLDELVQD
jgi:hypothetical protein